MGVQEQGRVCSHSISDKRGFVMLIGMTHSAHEVTKPPLGSGPGPRVREA